MQPPRQHALEMPSMLSRPNKTRKRGSSLSSSSSSVVYNYQVKKAFSTRKSRGSRSRTPATSWKLKGTSSPSDSSVRLSSTTHGPSSARKLAATLWEMNAMPPVEDRTMKRDRIRRNRVTASLRSNSRLPHLSDPSSHSPVSERTDRSEIVVAATAGGRKTPYCRNRKVDRFHGRHESASNASLVGKNHGLEDVRNALATSKELLKIISRICERGDQQQPPPTSSLISALDSEIERARLLVNDLSKDPRHGKDRMMDYLRKCLADERESWRKKEREVIDSAIESVAGQLEAERKLRRRLEGLNKKLGRELADVKSMHLNAIKEISEERAALAISRPERFQIEEEDGSGHRSEDSVRADRDLLKIAEPSTANLAGRSNGGDGDKRRRRMIGSHVLARLGSAIFHPSPTRQWGQSFK